MIDVTRFTTPRIEQVGPVRSHWGLFRSLVRLNVQTQVTKPPMTSPLRFS